MKYKGKYDIIKGMSTQDYIWDLGGTLLDNYESSTAAFVATLREYGVEAGHDEVYQALKISTVFAIEKFALNLPNFLELYKANEAKVLEYPCLFEGSEDLLESIVEQGGRNFLISHRDHQVLQILEKTGISPYFTEVVTAANGFARKPDPESMFYLKEKYQIRDALVIGDRDIDVEAGQLAGFHTYLFDTMPSLVKYIRDREGKI